jgi:diadenylate cyclase
MDHMHAIVNNLQRQITQAGLSTVLSTIIDIVLVAIAIYWLIMLSKRTRAWHIVLGLAAFVLLELLTDYSQLHTINYLLRSFMPLGPVAIVLLFYPELRSALENLGRVAGQGRGLAGLTKEDNFPIIEAVVNSACSMSSKKIGALIVIERQNALEDIISTGTRMDAKLTENLLGAVFYPGNPLHDGAAVIRGDRIIAAGCTLPLSESVGVGAAIHTRHKAALGLSEVSDSAIVVVSEETGTISLAHESRLNRGLNQNTLTEWLKTILGIGQDTKTAQIARKVNGTLKKRRTKSR